MNSTEENHTDYTVGLTKKNVTRVWMQGMNLVNSNFVKDVHYESLYNSLTRSVVLKIVPSKTATSRVVSGRKDKVGHINPIIELANADLLTVTQGAKKVRADFYENEIHISIHHLEIEREEREETLKANIDSGFIVNAALWTDIDATEYAEDFANKCLTARTEFIIGSKAGGSETCEASNTEIFTATLADIEPELLGYVDELYMSLPSSKESDAEDAAALFGAVSVIEACKPAVIRNIDTGSNRDSSTYILLRAMLSVMGYNITDIDTLADAEALGVEATEDRYQFIATSNGLPLLNITENSNNSANFFDEISCGEKSLLASPLNALKSLKKFCGDGIHKFTRNIAERVTARELSLKANLLKGFVTKGVLCAGIGISTAASHDGLAAEGIEARTVFVADREERYLDTAARNNYAITNKTTIFQGSLEEVNPRLLRYVNDMNISLPCTGHSPSGKAKNQNVVAEEHKLDATALLGAMTYLVECNPAAITSENVVPAKTSKTYAILRVMLDVMRYNISETNLDSANTGTFENRRRYWLTATSQGLGEFDIMENFPTFTKDIAQLSEILEHVPADSKMWKSTAEKERKAALNYANGKNFGFNLGDSSVTSVGVMGKGYQKDRASEFHLKGETKGTMRLLTPKEMAACQNVPYELIANTIDGVSYEALGQGIDFRQGMGVAQSIARGIYNNIDLQEISLAA
jgi:DNA (cytosine-5)-methyltransferase 1